MLLFYIRDSRIANKDRGRVPGSFLIQQERAEENLAEREGFEPSVQVLARTTV